MPLPLHERLTATPALDDLRARVTRSRQRRLLADTLRRARTLPGYSAATDLLDRGGSDPYEVLRGLPILERSTLQERPEDFADPAIPSLLLSSSGSTGVPLTLRLARGARRRRQRQFASYFLRAGWSPWHRSLSFKVLPDSSARLGSRAFDRSLLRRRHVVSVLEDPDRRYEVLRGVDPQILQGLPSVLEQLAHRAHAEAWRPSRLRCIFSCSETLAPGTRSLLERSFGAPVLDGYAAAEALVGFECERRRGIHVIPGNVVLEVLDDDGRSVPPGEVGRVVITTLDNPAMPLVRYAIGDMAVAPSPERCPCGRPGQLVPRILGRQVPLFEIRGERISPWGIIARMHELEFVQQFQLAQEAPDRILVLVRPRPQGAVDDAVVRRLVAEELGESVRAEVREVGEIDPLRTGKAAPALLDGRNGTFTS